MGRHGMAGAGERKAVKLVMNTISTATMARMGCVQGNWMAHVETTNKKLIDRGSRFIAELAGVSYEAACCELFRTNAELAAWTPEKGERPSPVAYTITQLKGGA